MTQTVGIYHTDRPDRDQGHTVGIYHMDIPVQGQAHVAGPRSCEYVVPLRQCDLWPVPGWEPSSPAAPPGGQREAMIIWQKGVGQIKSIPAVLYTWLRIGKTLWHVLLEWMYCTWKLVVGSVNMHFVCLTGEGIEGGKWCVCMHACICVCVCV